MCLFSIHVLVHNIIMGLLGTFEAVIPARVVFTKAIKASAAFRLQWSISPTTVAVIWNPPMHIFAAENDNTPISCVDAHGKTWSVFESCLSSCLKNVVL